MALQICKEEAGQLAEIEFVLFQEELLNVWNAEAQAQGIKPVEGEEEGGEGEHRRKQEL